MSFLQAFRKTSERGGAAIFTEGGRAMSSVKPDQVQLYILRIWEFRQKLAIQQNMGMVGVMMVDFKDQTTESLWGLGDQPSERIVPGNLFVLSQSSAQSPNWILLLNLGPGFLSSSSESPIQHLVSPF